MTLSAALSRAKVAFYVEESGDLSSRSLVLHVARETEDGRAVQRRETRYEAISPPRYVPDTGPWWVPMDSETTDALDSAPSPFSDGWTPGKATGDALSRDGIDTAGKALSALRGTDPDEATQADPEPPFTEASKSELAVREATADALSRDEDDPADSEARGDSNGAGFESRADLYRTILSD